MCICDLSGPKWRPPDEIEREDRASIARVLITLGVFVALIVILFGWVL